MPATSLPAALTASALLGGALLTAACGAPRTADTVEPLDRTPTTVSSAAAPGAPDTTATSEAVTTTLDPGAAEQRSGVDAATVDLVTDTLERYGELLGDLAADPAGAPAPGTAARAAWDALVLPGSPLSVELLDRLTQRTVEQRMVIEPGPDGVSYRHRPVHVDAIRTDDRGQVVEFGWCGWSPGIGRSIDSGEVLDDAVAHAAGSGHLVKVGDAWLLASLDEEDLELLAPGSPDPCPGLPGSGAR